MTTPKEAQKYLDWAAYACTGQGMPKLSDRLRDPANQVERLEAQRKELREALERARNQLDEDCFTDENKTECLKAVYAALKATE